IRVGWYHTKCCVPAISVHQSARIINLTSTSHNGYVGVGEAEVLSVRLCPSQGFVWLRSAPLPMRSWKQGQRSVARDTKPTDGPSKISSTHPRIRTRERRRGPTSLQGLPR